MFKKDDDTVQQVKTVEGFLGENLDTIVNLELKKGYRLHGFVVQKNGSVYIQMLVKDVEKKDDI